MVMSRQPQKRFIAGAVCPRCAQMDKLTLYLNEQQQQVRECVSCGYQDVMTDQGPAELQTRVNQPRPGEKPLSHEEEIQVINIVPPSTISHRDH